MTTTPRKILVIGSGFGGLAAAARLAARGHAVEVFEKRDQLGGRAYVYELNGFKFDGGPTVITAPFMFDDIFRAAGKRREDYFELVPLSPFYRIFDHDGRSFDYNADEGFTLSQIAKRNPADQDGYRRFIASTKAIFQKGFVDLADKPFLRLSDMLRVAPDLLRLQSHKSVYQYVSQFIHDDFLRQAFTFHPLLVGGNPFDTTSIYALIHYLEREYGVHYALGGTGAIVAGLGRLIAELGGRVHLNAEVDQILTDGRRVTGLRLKDDTVHYADVVVNNGDVAFTYNRLLPRTARTAAARLRLNTMQYSMSLFVIYFGTRRQYRAQGLAHHNILLGPRYRGLLDDVFKRKVLADDFSLYLHMPTLTDPSLAPAGHEAFYVLAPVPHLGAEIDWERVAPVFRDRVLGFLEERYLPGLRENLAALHHIDPRHFRDTLKSHLGAAFSVQPLLTQSAWFRPHNRADEFDNLYFVGAGTHPGAGLPGVLASAKIADDLIAQRVGEAPQARFTTARYPDLTPPSPLPSEGRGVS
jgi:phytoene desaturase